MVRRVCDANLEVKIPGLGTTIRTANRSLSDGLRFLGQLAPRLLEHLEDHLGRLGTRQRVPAAEYEERHALNAVLARLALIRAHRFPVLLARQDRVDLRGVEPCRGGGARNRPGLSNGLTVGEVL